MKIISIAIETGVPETSDLYGTDAYIFALTDSGQVFFRKAYDNKDEWKPCGYPEIPPCSLAAQGEDK